MSTGSRIEWTDATWNPVVGCEPVSPDCMGREGYTQISVEGREAERIS